MKKTTKVLIYFACFFVALQFVIFWGIYSDGYLNSPMELNEYLERGGNKIDYYLGYNLFTCLDTGIYARIAERFERILTSLLPILSISILWCMGLDTRHQSVQGINDVERSSETKEEGSKPFTKLNFYLTIILSVYYLYYSYIYITKFWLE